MRRRISQGEGHRNNCPDHLLEVPGDDAMSVASETYHRLYDEAEEVNGRWRFPSLFKADDFGTLLVDNDDQHIATTRAVEFLQSGAACWKR